MPESAETELLRIRIREQCRTAEFEDWVIALVQSRDVLAESMNGMQKQIGELSSALLAAEQELLHLRLDNQRLSCGRRPEPQLPSFLNHG